MAHAIRRLGVFMFIVGSIVVIAGLIPVGLALIDSKDQQPYLAAAIVGGLVIASGLALDWLGCQSLKNLPPAMPEMDVRPPAMRLSTRTGRSRGSSEDLMA